MTAARFGPWTLTALVVANMIGAGVFTTSGFALADLGSPSRVLWAWLAGAAIALAGALSYGALVRRMTASGGEYLFLSRALHPAAGYVAGWVSLLAGFTGAIAFAASAFEAYLVPAAARPAWLPPDAVALSLVFLCGALHGRVKVLGAVAQNIVVVVKLAFIAGVVAYALIRTPLPAWQGLRTAPDPGPFSWGAFALSVMWVSFSYSGFNAAVYVAGEARDAAHTVPRALVRGTLAVSVVYLVLNAMFVCAPPAAAVAGRADVAVAAAAVLGGEPLVLAMRAVVALALASSVSSMIMAGPRVYARMAADGVLPRALAFEGGTPGTAVWLQVVLAAVVILVTGLEQLLSYLGFTLSVSAALTVATLFVLRAREGARAVPVPGYPWVPLGFVAATVLFATLAAVTRPGEPIAGLVTLALGLVAWRIRHAR